MRRTIIATAVGIALFAVVAFAAGTFTVSSSLASGSQTSFDSCTTNVTVFYDVDYNDSLDGFVVSAVKVAASHAACNGKFATVELTNDGNGIGSAGPGEISALSTTWMSIDTPPLVSSVNDVHVVISTRG